MTSFIIGLAIGLVAAAILVIILHYTVFKNKPKPWLYIIILILFGIGGAAIQLKFFPSAEVDVPTPQEQIQNVTKTITDGWKNTNGGFTFEQIEKTQEDESAPTYEDQIVKLDLYDYGGFVVFSYKNGKVYHNASFYKSSEGLILDGMINMQCEMGRLVWFCKLDFNSFEWIDERNEAPKYDRGMSWFAWDTDNLVSLSNQSTLFWRDRDKWLITNRKQSNKFVLQNAAVLTGQNAVDNFTKFGEVELISDAASGFTAINTLYNYLYEQCKGQSYNTNILTDVTKLMCVPIPTALQQNYAIPAELQEEYNGAEYYGVYKCNIAVDITLKKGNKSKLATKNNVNYIETLKNDENTANQVTVEHIDAENDFAKVELTFAPKQEVDLTGLNLSENPVTITFTSGTDRKSTKITSLSALNKTNTVLLGANKTWNYTISSNALLFDDFQGSFELSKSGALEFEYDYQNGYVTASVGLNPVGTVDMTKVDLANYPVRIILSNATDTYQFIFNSNSQINDAKTQTVKLGSYNYTILSDQLTFASTSGSLTITTTDRNMLFNYAYVENAQVYDITATITQNEPSAQGWITFDGLDWNDVLEANTNPRSNPGLVFRVYSTYNNALLDTIIDNTPANSDSLLNGGMGNRDNCALGQSGYNLVLLQISFSLNGKTYTSNVVTIQGGKDISIHLDVQI